jgi:putative permease
MHKDPAQWRFTAFISTHFSRYFSDPDALSFFFILLLLGCFFNYLGGFFLPVLLSIAIAYLLHSLVRLCRRCHLPQGVAVGISYIVFLSLFLYLLLGLLPFLWKQLVALTAEMPAIFSHLKLSVVDFLRAHPGLLSIKLVDQMTDAIKKESTYLANALLHFSLSTLSNVVQLTVYCVLVPLLVFFFLKDGRLMIDWTSRFFPQDNALLRVFFTRVGEQISHYVRARVFEIILVGGLSSALFLAFGLEYAVLLGFFVGLSVIIPYVGAFLVTIPVVVIALMQWGLGAHFVYLMIAYGVLVALDANLLVPWLFSRTMHLHPAAIILALFVFGGVWGFWGVFFAIPLATVVNTVITIWPARER